jgi:ABC-type amino acid transport substrate-binding protein/nitrogen-specific signal transduction histidine kinase
LRAIWTVSLAIWILQFLATIPASAQQPESATPTDVRIAYFEFPPYSYTGPDGTAEGFSIALLQRLLEDRSMRLVSVPAANPGEMLDLVRNGQADAAGVLSLTAERSREMLQTAPVGAFTAALFARTGNGRTVGDFENRRISALRRSLGVDLAQGIAGAEVVELSSTDAQIIALLDGTVDAMLGDTGSMLRRMRDLGVDPLVYEVSPPVQTLPYAFYVNVGRPDLQSAINAGIASLPAKALAQLHATHFGVPTKLRAEALFEVALAAACVIALLALHLFRKHRHSTQAARRLQAQTDDMKLLIDALDGINAAIVIYDKEFRAIHWNAGFDRSFPGMTDLLSERATMFELIRESRQNGSITLREEDGDTEDILRRVEAKLRAGESVCRVVHASNGLVYEAAEFPVGATRYASVRIDVTNLHRQREMIERQNVSLASANEQLAMFATVAAHDLKAPLNQQDILLDAICEDLAEAGIDIPAEVADYIGHLKDTARRMIRLIEDLLTHARAGNSSEIAETFKPNDRLDSIIAMAGLPDAFTVSVQPDLPELTVPPTEFDTVIRNLLSNACKHHDRSAGRIDLRGERVNETITLQIEDDGPGIPPEFRQQVFEPFKTLAADKGGSGLGLSFIQKTVENWGGTVWITDASPRGCVFNLRLPARAGTIEGEEHSGVAAA